MDIFSTFSAGVSRPSLSGRLIRAAGGTLSYLAPGCAARLAARIWATIPLARDFGPIPKRAMPVQLEMGGRTAVGYLWNPAGAVQGRVLVQHGWGGSTAQLGELIGALVNAGASVVAFDAFGHGDTGPGRHGGRQSSLVELSDLVKEVDRKFGPFTAVVAHSAAAAAVARAIRQGVRVDRAVFLAPLVDPLGQCHLLSKALGLSEAVARNWPELLLAKFGATRNDIDMTSLPSLDRIPQTLIVQDQGDGLSPPEGARQLHRAWRGSQLLETEGLGHYRVLKDPNVLSSLVQFVIDGYDRDADDSTSVAQRQLQTRADAADPFPGNQPRKPSEVLP